MKGGAIEIDSIDRIELFDITPALSRESGFKSVVDLLKIAKHGSGNNVYLVRFHFVPNGTRKASHPDRVGLWLDVDEMNWSAVELAVHEAYSSVVPRSLRASIQSV